jgi:hypothetical protein
MPTIIAFDFHEPALAQPNRAKSFELVEALRYDKRIAAFPSLSTPHVHERHQLMLHTTVASNPVVS